MKRRALVLSAGGPAASAWETGVIAGMAKAGIDVRNADLFIGTSAGSCVAAQITSGLTLEELFQQQIDPRLQAKGPEVKVDFRKLKEEYARARHGDGGNIEILKRMGALAMTASTVSESDRRKAIASQLPEHTWPGQALLAVAVDAESGERRAFDRASGVPLIDAVAASCAAPGMSPAITIDGHRYMDGGCYSIDNADLAGRLRPGSHPYPQTWKPSQFRRVAGRSASDITGQWLAGGCCASRRSDRCRVCRGRRESPRPVGAGGRGPRRNGARASHRSPQRGRPVALSPGTLAAHC
jgi:NTE family protein